MPLWKSCFSIVAPASLNSRVQLTSERVTLLSSSSNISSSDDVIFSLTTSRPPFCSAPSALCINLTASSSFRWPKAHCTQTTAYLRSDGGIQSCSPTLKISPRPSGASSAMTSVNFLIGSIISTSASCFSRRPLVILPILHATVSLPRLRPPLGVYSYPAPPSAPLNTLPVASSAFPPSASHCLMIAARVPLD